MSKARNKKKRILIVDDDPDITKTFGLILEDSRLYEGDTYNEPLIALQNLDQNSYDLALFDIRVPKMNGFELSDKIEKIDDKVKPCFISALIRILMNRKSSFYHLRSNVLSQNLFELGNLQKG